MDAHQDLPDYDRRVGRFRILRTLGRGGMAVVYEAEDPELGRRVALKVLREGEADPRVIQRLHREALAAAKIQHPNIVAVHEVGTARDSSGEPTHFIAMELVEGPTLARLLDERRTPRRELLRMLEDLARAADVAHREGIVHRDLKPANVIIDRAGRARLTDFGLAHVESAESRLTRSNAVMGTPHYMAPEQVAGSTREIDARTDVYALGVMLYEILTGRLPFQGQTPVEIYRAILQDDPAHPSQVSRDVDADLEIICLKAMDRDRARRYRTAAAFADDLARHARGEPIHGRAPSAAYLLRKFLVRRKTAVAAAATGLAAALAVAAWFVPRAVTRERERQKQAAAVEAKERELLRERELAREREMALKELGALWAQVVLAKQGFHNAATDPSRVRADLEEAVRRVSDYIARHADHPQGFYVRARGWLYLDELEKAEQDLNSAMALAPDFAPGEALLGRVMLEQFARTLYGDPKTAARRSERARKFLESARLHFARGWIDGAERASIEKWGLIRTPEDDVAHVQAQAFATSHEDLSKAQEFLREAHHRRPSAEYCVLMGVLVDAPAERARWATEALQLMPHCYRACVDRAIARLMQGDAAGAVDDAGRAIAINPGLMMAYAVRGSAREQLGELEGALDDFTRAIEIDGRLAEVILGRGNVRRRRGEIREAIEDFTSAIAVDPDFAEAYHNRGEMRTALGDFDGAIADYTRAIAAAPTLAAAYTGRGVARQWKRDLEGALADYTTAIGLDPHNPVPFENRGLVREWQGEYQAALEDASRAIEIDPNRPSVYFNRGNARQSLGDAEGALRDLTKAIELHPGYAEAYNNRGLVRYGLGDREGGIADVERALQLAPPDWPVRAGVEARLKQLKAGR